MRSLVVLWSFYRFCTDRARFCTDRARFCTDRARFCTDQGIGFAPTKVSALHRPKRTTLASVFS